jgi:prepilin-type processing-associated H-X9-DG protein
MAARLKDSGSTQPRRAARVPLDAHVSLRRAGTHAFPVRLFDASPLGSKLEFVERPRLEERVWIKFDGLNAIEAMVCWVDGHVVGVEFVQPMHPAVFDALIKRIG